MINTNELDELEKEFEELWNKIKSSREKDREIIAKANEILIGNDYLTINAFDRIIQPLEEQLDILKERVEKLEKVVKYDCVKVVSNVSD